MTGFGDIPRIVLGRLEGQPPEVWSRSNGTAWSPGQIVAHLAAAIDTSALGFESRADKPPMQRRKGPLRQRIARIFILKTGRIPGRRLAPEATRPEVAPDRDATMTRLRTAVQRFQELERRLLPARENDLFLKHPALGDLTLREFMRFHVVHALHHAKQMDARLRDH